MLAMGRFAASAGKAYRPQAMNTMSIDSRLMPRLQALVLGLSLGGATLLLGLSVQQLLLHPQPGGPAHRPMQGQTGPIPACPCQAHPAVMAPAGQPTTQTTAPPARQPAVLRAQTT
jgi:hypothetical protein